MKSWFKQKTTLAGIAAILTGTALIINGDTAGGLQLIGTGVIGIFLRQAVNKE